uniref:Myophilin-like n=1 Tax=Ciona intestinalis TaxID=7719 RepID=F7A7T2_CIOIN|nr:myophilin-like [Ciona intestinalis]|eukprot:XP_002129393.1 myophilin-like [Ciona intestinalis]
MANKGYAYGLSADVARKIAGKRDPAKEKEVEDWIKAITEVEFDAKKSFEENLKNGIILCKLANKLVPKSVKKISDSNMPFKLMENIQNFLTMVENYGVPKTDLFQTVDLFEASNIPAVTATLFALGRVCHSKPEFEESSPSYKNWPTLGPKPSAENKREFDEQTLIEGKKIIGIQAGTNKLASQSGQSFGGRRQVNK